MAQRPTPSVRPLAPADLDRVVAIDQAITGRSRRGFYARRLAALAEDPEWIVALGAEREGRLAAFALAHVLDGEFGGAAPVGVLDAIGVDPELRRAGAGRALAVALDGALAGRGARELRTEADWTEHELVNFFAATGLRLSPRLVLERSAAERLDDGEADEAEGGGPVVRSMAEQDLPALVRLDRKLTGRDRTTYYRRKTAEVLRRSGVRVSLVAEVAGQVAGFVMARVDLGEYGRTEPTAVLDTIAVDPGLAQRGVGRALLGQLLLNLGSLRVERVVTQVAWNDLDLVGFLAGTGFERSQRLSFEKPLG